VIAGRALRPVSQILRGLQQIQAGDYDARLKRPGLPELDRIIEGINHVSKTLKEARDENRALTRHSLEIQEEERRTLAKEMHDEVGQNLTAIKMMSALIPEDAENRAHAALEIQRLCDRLFCVVRSIIHRLRPMILEDLGLKAALDDLSDHWRSISPDIHLAIRCDETLENLSGEIALEIYRIVQEAMTNIVRHSGATEAEVRIHPNDQHQLLLIVRDNGRGLSPDITRRGFGLLGMRERVASLDGLFHLMTEPGQGLEIRISLPIPEIKND
jgi:two-component system sensor histidine kinase UhpB